MRFDYCEHLDGPQSFRDVSGRMILCKGGGGGDDGGAAAREAERQKRIADGTKAVNAMFGVGPATEMAPTGQRNIKYYERPVTVQDADGNETTINERVTLDAYDKAMAQPKTTAGAKGGGQATSAFNPIYEDVLGERQSTAGQNAIARQKLYDETRENSRQFYTQQLDEDSEKARREMSFQKARQGITGSSQANDLDTDFSRRRDRGLIDVANRSDMASTQFRTNDEQTRMNLISKIVAGMDQGSAVQNAINTMQTNSAQANEAYKSQRVGNMFTDLLAGYNQGQFNSGMRSAEQQYQNQLGNYFPNGTGSSGASSGEKTRT